MGCLLKQIMMQSQPDYSVTISINGQRSLSLSLTSERNSLPIRWNSKIFSFDGFRSSREMKVNQTAGAPRGVLANAIFDPPHAFRQTAEPTNDVAKHLILVKRRSASRHRCSRAGFRNIIHAPANCPSQGSTKPESRATPPKRIDRYVADDAIDASGSSTFASRPG
jgi:hypothetical protein